jgi:hypothetical protein
MGRISTDVLGAYLDGDSAISQELLHDALSGKALKYLSTRVPRFL